MSEATLSGFNVLFAFSLLAFFNDDAEDDEVLEIEEDVDEEDDEDNDLLDLFVALC